MYGFLAVFLSVLILCFISVCGVIVKRLTCRFLKREGEAVTSLFDVPVIGIATIVCVTQTLNLALPVRAIAVLLSLPIIIGAVLCRKDILAFLVKIKEKPFIPTVSFFTLFLTLLPCIRYNDLLCLHFANNDVAYYLSSMEWLRDHTFLEPVGFSSTAPFDSLANYMLRNTRIGTDILGAFTLSLIPLEAHQIYLILCAVFNVLCVFSASYLSESLGIGYKFIRLSALFIGTGCSVIELTKQQYAPQLFGIALFTLYIAVLVRFFINERGWKEILGLGLLATATISVYAEYASYAVILFIIAFAVKAFTDRNAKALLNSTLDSFKMVIAAFLLNAPGFLIALKFNLNVIFSQLGSLENIDPYHGNITDLPKLLWYVLNVDLPGLRAFFGSGVFFKLLFCLCLAVCVAIVCAVAVHTVRGAVKTVKRYETLFLLGSLAFFIAYFFFFRITRYAYGEYKHIHLTLIPTVLIILYFVSASLDGKEDRPEGGKLAYVIKVFDNVSARAVLPVIICLSLVNTVAFSVNSRSPYRFDSSLNELNGAVTEFVPHGEAVGIMNGYYFEAHSMVYALRNSERRISLLTPDSYFTPHTGIRPIFPKYIVTTVTDAGEFSDILSLEDYTVVWKNTRHALIKSNTDVGAFADYGFSGLNTVDPKNPFRTVGEGSGIVIWNTGDAEKLTNVDFATATAPDGVERGFKVYLDGTLLFEGRSGDTVSVPSLKVPAKGSISLRIEVENASGNNALSISALDTDVIG